MTPETDHTESAPYPATECCVCGNSANAFLPGRWVAHPDGTACLLDTGELAPRFRLPSIPGAVLRSREVARRPQ